MDYKGKLIYQTPLDIYRKYRKKDLHNKIFLDIFFISLFIIGIIYFYFEKLCLVVFVLITFIIIILLTLLLNFHHFQLLRFKIYEKGYIPPRKPLTYFLTDQEHFIPFRAVFRVEYIRWGEVCMLWLKNGKKSYVNVDWGDINGYIKFSKIIKKYFPETIFPDLKIIIKRYNAWEKYLDGKISKKEHDLIYYEMVEINREFRWI